MENIQTTRSLKTILVTTTRAYSDGSSVAADIATMVAHNGKRVALLDADLRCPLVHNLFNLPNRVGLIDILHGQRSLSGVIHSVNSNHLFVLTAGQSTKGKSDPFTSSKMAKLISQLNSDFDKIIIHGPPFFYTEATTLATKVDGIVLLIHPGHTKSDTSRAIMDKFQKTGAKIIGIVMRNQPKYQMNQSAFIDKLLTFDRRARLAP